MYEHVTIHNILYLARFANVHRCYIIMDINKYKNMVIFVLTIIICFMLQKKRESTNYLYADNNN